MSELELELQITGILDASSETREMGHCKHCGNFTLMLNRKIYNYKDDRVILDELDNRVMLGKIDDRVILSKPEEKPHEELVWLIQECFVCKRLTLRERRLHFDFGDSSFWMEDEILYPVIKTSLYSLPSPLKKAYEAALKVKSMDPNSFALLAGQTLESVCRYEQAQGKTFHEKLKYLAQKGRIPDTLAEMARQVRLLRNLAAHDAKDEVTEKDVPFILEFLEAILEYLYIAPAKIKAVQARLTHIDEDDLGYM